MLPAQLPLDEVLEKLRPWLESDQHAKLGQNLKYDAHVLANHGIRLGGIVHDTLLESYVLESDKPHDMDSLAKRHLGLATIPYTDVCGKGAKQIGFDEVDVGARHRIRRRGRRRHPAPAPPPATRSSRPCRSSTRSTASSRCRCSACCSAWSAPGC